MFCHPDSSDSEDDAPSEAVGEVLVSRAVARGEVAGCIARLGMVSACARTGRSHPHHAPGLAVISH